MMCSLSRLVMCTLLAGGVFCSGVGRAQEPVQFKIKPERMRHAREVEQQAQATHDSLLLAEAWYLYGKTYVFAGDYQTAQTYFMKALRVHEPRGDSFELSRLYVRLSENEGRLGRPLESLRLAQLSLAVAQRVHSDKALIRSYGALGRVYESMWAGRLGNRREYDRSHAMYKKREELSYKLHDTLGIAEVSMELGTLYARIDSVAAIPYLKKALVLFTYLNEPGVRTRAMVHLAAAYLMAGKPALAFSTLQSAETVYQTNKLNEYDIRLELEKNFVDYFRAVGQWEDAFAHLEKVKSLEHRQLLADNNGAITRLNIEFQTEKKEALLLAQNKELALRLQTLQTQQRLTSTISVLLAIAVGMSLVLFRLNRRNKRISQRNADLVKEQNHRVKNNLQVVASLLSLQSKRLTDEAAKKAVDESRLRVQSMAILHRRLYDGDRLAEASLDVFIREVVGEVLNTYGYAAVQTRFSIDAISLSADKAVPLALIINELTTNACKYAFPATNAPCYFVGCRRHKRTIELRIADNGPGLERSDVSGPGLERSDVSGPGLERSDGRTPDVSGAEQGGPINTVSESGTLLSTLPVSFGMQLIQAQVEQLGGRYTFSTADAVWATGVVFTMEFKG